IRGADKSERGLALSRQNCLVNGRGEAVERQLLAVVGELLDEAHGVAAGHEDKTDIRALINLGDVGTEIGRAQPRQQLLHDLTACGLEALLEPRHRILAGVEVRGDRGRLLEACLSGEIALKVRNRRSPGTWCETWTCCRRPRQRSPVRAKARCGPIRTS